MIRHSPHAPVDIAKPEPPGYCDRCNFKYLRRNLTWQHDWRGPRLANLRILVCERCLDVPQPSGRKPIKIGPDPVPVRDPRPGFSHLQMNQPPSATLANSAQEILGEGPEVYWEPAIEFDSGQDVGAGPQPRPYGRGPYGKGPYSRNVDQGTSGVFRYG